MKPYILPGNEFATSRLGAVVCAWLYHCHSSSWSGNTLRRLHFSFLTARNANSLSVVYIRFSNIWKSRYLEENVRARNTHDLSFPSLTFLHHLRYSLWGGLAAGQGTVQGQRQEQLVWGILGSSSRPGREAACCLQWFWLLYRFFPLRARGNTACGQAEEMTHTVKAGKLGGIFSRSDGQMRGCIPSLGELFSWAMRRGFLPQWAYYRPLRKG